MSEPSSKPVLVVGATGYVGGRLVPLLLESGYRVRALARNPDKLTCRPWAENPLLEVVKGDALDEASMIKAAAGCRAVFFLVHSMIAQKEKFVEADRLAARNMARAAEMGGLEQVIYLGGLVDIGEASVSKHLKSRHEVAEILQAGTVPCTTLRAPMILGSGSASFEILRYLVEHLPVMTTPRWVFSPNQPISISNVLIYLKGCLEKEETIGQSYDIGGPDIISYREMLDVYAQEAGLRKRWVIPVPVLTPTLSAYWIHLISPVPASIARPLTEGLTSSAVCRENRIRAIIPQRLLSCREAIRRALDRIRQQQTDTCWKDAGKLLTPEWAYCGDAEWAGGLIKSDGYRLRIAGSLEDAWAPIARIGGETGWYRVDAMWRLRGWVDRLTGGPGMRRGRRHPVDINVGDAIDFWRVLHVAPPTRLLLRAEMKLPGDALLGFQLNSVAPGQTEMEMVSRFLPKGSLGLAYWFLIFPLHRRVFRAMLAGIGAATGMPILQGPEVFDPGGTDTCRLPAGDPPSSK